MSLVLFLLIVIISILTKHYSTESAEDLGKQTLLITMILISQLNILHLAF